jgi:hypothetical protein
VTESAHTASATEEATGPWRCARCGVESSERTCFIIPRRHGRPPRDIRCLTCEQRRLSTKSAGGAAGALGSILFPLVILGGLGGLEHSSLGAVAGLVLMYPAAIVAHELGHASAAWALGLEVGGIAIGHGRVLRTFEIAGLPIRIHQWPLSGCVFLGSESMRFLRTRLWLATLMGPLTNAVLAAASAVWWGPLQSIVGTVPVELWFIINMLLVLSALWPARYQGAWGLQSSDGRALFRIPAKPRSELSLHLYVAPFVRAWFRFDAGDFAGAKPWLERAIDRVPENIVIRVMRSACHLSLGDYAVGRAELSPMLENVSSGPANVRAAVYNNTAFAIFMSNPVSSSVDAQILEAERLSAEAFAMYPCILEYRTMRALLLTATCRPDEALGLLEYIHYEVANGRQRAHREAARAFALKHLGRADEAQDAAKQAVRLNQPMNAMLESLGLPTGVPA